MQAPSILDAQQESGKATYCLGVSASLMATTRRKQLALEQWRFPKLRILLYLTVEYSTYIQNTRVSWCRPRISESAFGGEPKTFRGSFILIICPYAKLL